jgi:hypothetical protein
MVDNDHVSLIPEYGVMIPSCELGGNSNSGGGDPAVTGPWLIVVCGLVMVVGIDIFI